MKSFLLVYDRKAGSLRHFQEFSASDRAEALAERFRWEERERETADVEVVVLRGRADWAGSLRHGHPPDTPTLLKWRQ